jgi:hypothetical protein
VTPLEQLIARYSPEIAAIARGALPRMRKRFAGAHELVYDNYNALVIGFSTNDRGSGAVCSIALYPKWVRLFFANGATLPDPSARLEGSGARVRSVLLESARTLDEPAVRKLLDAAARQAGLVAGARRPTVIKSVTKKQRPRR